MVRELRRSTIYQTPELQWIEIYGNDRVSFLHSFCTQDIKGMTPGSMREGFFLNARGKLLAFADILVLPECIVLSSLGAQFELLVPHLEKYIIREDVVIKGPEPRASTFVGIGDAAAELYSVWVEQEHEKTLPAFSDKPTSFAQIGPTGHIPTYAWTPSWLPGGIALTSRNEIALPTDHFEVATDSLGLLEGLRIANRSPKFGVDFDGNYLPQELKRDATAISFKKGCYLGQETVARIDALGHVNRFVVAVKATANNELSPSLPISIVINDAEIGKVTSIANVNGEAIGLATVKRNFAAAGTKFTAGNADWEVLS